MLLTEALRKNDGIMKVVIRVRMSEDKARWLRNRKKMGLSINRQINQAIDDYIEYVDNNFKRKKKKLKF